MMNDKTSEFNNEPVSMSLMLLIDGLRRKMREPRFDLVAMSYLTGIDYNSLYKFKCGVTNNPRIDNLDKMITYLLPEVRIVSGQTKDAA
jgi:hypothetical protein